MEVVAVDVARAGADDVGGGGVEDWCCCGVEAAVVQGLAES